MKHKIMKELAELGDVPKEISWFFPNKVFKKIPAPELHRFAKEQAVEIANLKRLLGEAQDSVIEHANYVHAETWNKESALEGMLMALNIEISEAIK